MTPLAHATPHQRQALEAYVATGSIKAAASQLGIKEQAARHRLQALYRRTGLRNVAEAAYWLGWEKSRVAA